MKKSIACLLAAIMVLSGLAVLPVTIFAANPFVLDFGTDGEALASGTGYMALQGDGFTRWSFLDMEAEPALALNTTHDTTYKWMKLAYRTEAQSVHFTVLSGGRATDFLTSDGLWHETVFQLNPYGGDTPGGIRFEMDRPVPTESDFVDIAYIAFFETDSEAEAYKHGEFNVNKYVAEAGAIPQYNVTADSVGSYYNTNYKPYGQRFTADEAFVGIFVPQNSFYKGTQKNNEGTVKVWAWDTDYATTTAADPLRTVMLSHLEDKADLKAVFAEELAAGEYFFEVTMTNPSNGAYVAKVSTGAHKDGVESYCGGEKTDKALCAGYLVEGYMLTYLGNEYTTKPAIEYNFSLYTGSATKEYGMTDVTGVTVTEECDKGYLSLTGDGAASSVTFPVHYAYTNESDVVVMRYRLAEGGATTLTVTATTANATYSTTLTLTADGQWHNGVSTNSNWAAAIEKEITSITLSGISGNLDITYLGFYANGQAGADCVNGMTGEPKAPLSAEEALPVVLIDGENLNMKEGNQCHGSEYNYDKGSLTLTSKGTHPYYSVISEPTKVAPILAIRYRVPASKQAVQAKYYIGSNKTAATGGTGDDYGTFDYIADGLWHTAYVDLTDLAAYNDETNVINYFRFDFLNGLMVGDDSTLEIAYYAFFNTVEEAQSFRHDVPCLYTVVFDTGLVKAYANFHKTDSKEYVLSLAPTIYPVDGYTVTWEDFEVGAYDLELHLVYTPVGEINNPAEELDKLEGQGAVKPGDTVPDGEDETTDAEGTSEVEGDDAGDATDVVGCGAVVASAAILSVMVMGAGVVICKKKD